MKTIILCLFFISQCFCIAPPAEPEPELEPSFPGHSVPGEAPKNLESEDRSERVSREVPPPKPSNEEEHADCPFKCTDESKKKFEKDQVFLDYLKQLEQPIRFKDQFLPKHLSQYCEMIGYTEQCTKQCPESKYKTFILEGLEMQSICKDKRMLDENSGFNEVFNEKLEECTQVCSEYGNNLTEIVNEREPSLNRTEILEISCNYMKCFTGCERDALKAKVGEDNTKYYERLVGQSIKFTRASAQVNGEKLELPEICLEVEKLGHDDEIQVDINEEEQPPVEEPPKPVDE